MPLEGAGNTQILVGDQAFDPKVSLAVRRGLRHHASGYFAASGIRLLKGRTLAPEDFGEDNIGAWS